MKYSQCVPPRLHDDFITNMNQKSPTFDTPSTFVEFKQPPFPTPLKHVHKFETLRLLPLFIQRGFHGPIPKWNLRCIVA